MDVKIFQAWAVLQKTYYKILRINLATDQFEQIKVLQNQTVPHGKLHVWCQQFIQAGGVYESDVESFSYLINNELHHGANLYYRRKMGNKYVWSYLEIFNAMDYSEQNPIVIMYIRDSDNNFIKHIAQQEQIKYQSRHDALTSLQNRTAFNVLKQQWMDSSVGIIYSDLNKLKYYNDTFGHDAGDNYICTYAKILHSVFRPQDCYRLGGDEFVMIIRNIQEAIFNKKVIELHAALANSEVSCAIGSSWSATADLTRLEFMIKQAQVEMYKNKHRI